MADSMEGSLATSLNQRAQGLGRLSAKHPLATDAVLAGLIAALNVVALVTVSRLDARVALVCAGLTVPLLLRHRSPTVCLAALSVAGLVQCLWAGPQLADASVLVALYFVALEAQPRACLVAVLVAEAGAALASNRWARGAELKYWVGLSGLVVAAAALGVMVRQRRALLTALEEKASRLERERDQQGRLGAAAERARIAREMHDIVAHNLSVMIALADGAGYALRASPERACAAIDQVSATGRQALLEMRRLLGVLRDDDATEPFEPQPTLERLEDLVARVEAAGVPVTVELDGDPRDLADGVQLAIFRVAQEALTNTLKHAPRPTNAHLSLRCLAGAVDLELTNTARPASHEGDPSAAAPAGAPPTTSGRGLHGMRERASAYGGELEAGPTPDGGWRVHLRLGPDPAGAAAGRRSAAPPAEVVL